MQIINDYGVNNIFETTFSTQSNKKSEENRALSFDTVSISDAAMQAYVDSKAASAENENKSEDNPTEQFKKQFNSYRGNGIFSEDDSVSKDNSVEGPEKAQQAEEEEKISKTVPELERKIKDLTEKLEAVMSSNMPEHEKDMMANQIHKELEELQSQLNAYKQAEKAMASAQ